MAYSTGGKLNEQDGLSGNNIIHYIFLKIVIMHYILNHTSYFTLYCIFYYLSYCLG